MKKILIALLASLAFSLNALAAVNINTATQQELESLEGIGPVKAQAIVDYRKKNGNFKSVDDLEKVEGVGAITLQNLRKDVAVSGRTTVVAPVAKDTSLTKAAESKTGDVKAKKAKADTKAKSDLIKDGKPAKETSLVKAAESSTADTKTTKAKKEPKAKESKADVAKDAKVAKDTSLVKAAEAKTKEEKPAKAKKSAKAQKEDAAKTE